MTNIFSVDSIITHTVHFLSASRDATNPRDDVMKSADIKFSAKAFDYVYKRPFQPREWI